MYYLTNNPDYELWKINIQISENDISFEPAQSFFNGRNRFYGNRYHSGDNFEIHPNGDRFLVKQREYAAQEVIEPRIKAIVNWEQELEGN